MAQVQAVFDRARDILMDPTGVRYTDPQLLNYYNDALQHARTVRPDLFIGSLATSVPEETSAGNPFPLPLHFIAAFAFYLAGRAEIRDDEFAVDGRAMTLLGALTQKLVQGI